MPDDVVTVEAIPLGATGKIDKKLIRSRWRITGFRRFKVRAKPLSREGSPRGAAVGASFARR
ncbi:hypothetical protein AB5I41_12575 [Sphingomonas sp. MMS24-JH45]